MITTVSSNEFNTFFESIYTVDDGHLPEIAPDTSPGIIDVVVTEEGIFHLLNNVDPKKCPGADAIHNEFLRRYAEWISKYLFIIFKVSLRYGVLPMQWKVGKIIPIHKSGDRNNPSNYRPVSLTSTCSKLLEHIMFSHMIQYLDNHNILTPFQHGFRKSLSTSTQLIELVHELANRINDRGQTDLIFLDLSKAFDRVSHPKLLLKLSAIFKNDQLITWMTSYLSNRSQYVCLEDGTSSLLPVTSGVPQGSVLGPLLFLIYINDIVKDVQVPVKLFADDCVIYSEIKSPQDQVALNEALLKIKEWSDKWQMKINNDKTVAMTITWKKNPLKYCYSIDAIPIKFVDHYKYLGVTITSKLLWNQHIDDITNKARAKLYTLRRTLKFADNETKKTAYQSIVRPILEYAHTVWYPHTAEGISKLESVQRLAGRFIFNKFRYSVSASSLLEQANIPPLEVRAKIDRLRNLYSFINGIFNVSSDRYIQFSSSGSARLNHTRAIKQYPLKHDVFKYSFFPRAISEWNSLTNEIVTLPSLDIFVEAIASAT